MFSAELMMAAIIRRPSVVGPTSTSSTRGDAVATVSKYFWIAGQSASLPSAPILKPKNASGAGTWANAAPGAHSASASSVRPIAVRQRGIISPSSPVPSPESLAQPLAPDPHHRRPEV